MRSEVVMTCIGKGRMLIGRLGRCIYRMVLSRILHVENLEVLAKTWLGPNIRKEPFASSDTDLAPC